MSGLVTTLLELTDRVHAAIDAGEWSQAQQLEAERRRLLEELAAGAARDDTLAPAFAALASRTHRLIGLVEHHKRRVLREAAVSRSAHDGVAAYASAAAAAE